MKSWCEYTEVDNMMTGLDDASKGNSETVICDDWKQGLDEAISLSISKQTMYGVQFKTKRDDGIMGTYFLFVLEGTILAVAEYDNVVAQLALTLNGN